MRDDAIDRNSHQLIRMLCAQSRKKPEIRETET